MGKSDCHDQECPCDKEGMSEDCKAWAVGNGCEPCFDCHKKREPPAFYNNGGSPPFYNNGGGPPMKGENLLQRKPANGGSPPPAFYNNGGSPPFYNNGGGPPHGDE